METLPLPKTQTQEILYLFLCNPGTSYGFSGVYSHTKCINLGQRIAGLRRLGLEIPCYRISTKNKFGNSCSWGVWKLADNEVEKAIEIYKQLTSKI